MAIIGDNPNMNKRVKNIVKEEKKQENTLKDKYDFELIKLYVTECVDKGVSVDKYLQLVKGIREG